MTYKIYFKTKDGGKCIMRNAKIHNLIYGWQCYEIGEWSHLPIQKFKLDKARYLIKLYKITSPTNFCYDFQLKELI